MDAVILRLVLLDTFNSELEADGDDSANRSLAAPPVGARAAAWWDVMPSAFTRYVKHPAAVNRLLRSVANNNSVTLCNTVVLEIRNGPCD